MLLPAVFRGLEEDYWHLCEAVQLWECHVSDRLKFWGRRTKFCTVNDAGGNFSPGPSWQCLYAPLCDENGYMIMTQF
ncbi:MAG: hypothetical protein Ct9H300mP28_29360 [Pseudomonadota bacterium]|nr:MAG: hypothetical protein Ct9H300mP28_29360 [Pseudomonadota bacterium]